MGFNLYFAGGHTPTSDEFMMNLGGNRLYTQSYERKIGERWMSKIKETGKPLKLFVDSSAFSAHTKGLKVDIDEYLDYVNTNAGMFSCVAELDEIPGEFRKPKTREQMLAAPQKSWDNYLYMRERIYDPNVLLPIFHQGEDWKWLHKMLAETFEGGKHIPYIGISPANDVTTAYKDRWMEQVFRVIRDSPNPEVKTHAFGMTALKQLNLHPFYSADSTTAVLTGAMGGILTDFGPVDLSIKSGGVQALNYGPRKIKDNVESLLAELGHTIEDAANDHQVRAFYNIKFLIDWANNYEFVGIAHKQKKLF